MPHAIYKNIKSLCCTPETNMILQVNYSSISHSSTLAWKIPWSEEPGGLQSMGSLRVGHDWATSLSCIGGGNGNPLQCSCLENPRDGGAWWAAIYGVAQSQTQLKRHSSSSSSIAQSKKKGGILNAYIKESKSIWKDYILYDFTCITFWRRQNYGDNKRAMVAMVSGERGINRQSSEEV